MTDFFDNLLARFERENQGSADVDTEPVSPPAADYRLTAAVAAIFVAILIFRG